MSHRTVARCAGAVEHGWTIHGIGLQTKLHLNEFTWLILKGRGSRGGPYDRGPWSCVLRLNCSDSAQ